MSASIECYPSNMPEDYYDGPPCCLFTGRTWKKIVLGTLLVCNLSALIITITGFATRNNNVIFGGLLLGFSSSLIGLCVRITTREYDYSDVKYCSLYRRIFPEESSLP